MLALAVGAAGCGSSSDGPAEANTAAPSASTSSTRPVAGTSVLGVLTANGGSFADGKLTLKDVDPRAVWFTDRPARRAGTDGIDAFTKLFFTGDDPPNAAVKVAGAPASQDLAVLELSKPSYDPDARTLSFAANTIPASESKRDTAQRVAAHPGIAEAIAGQDGSLPATFGAVSVFVDMAQQTVKTTENNPQQETVTTSETAGDGQQVQEVANETAAAQSLVQQTLFSYQSLAQKDPRTCVDKMILRLTLLMNRVLSQYAPSIQQLQADLQQDPELSDAERQTLASVKQNVENVNLSAGIYANLLPQYREGLCPWQPDND